MTELDRTLAPPQTKGNISVAKLDEWWYAACLADELKTGPMPRTLLGTPLVLFRNEHGVAGALLDRCPHRNVPLSKGKVTADGVLQCGYHGWCFNVAGDCTNVPGLIGDPDSRGRTVTRYPTIERDGFIWVWCAPEVEPHREPFALPDLRDGYTTVRQTLQVEGTVWSTAENVLDVPHTAYLHSGLFRGTGPTNEIVAHVRRWHDRVEAEFIGEPRPGGVIGKMLSPSGGIVEHWDRFFLPSVAQVEYKLGVENHIVVTTVLTPVTDFVTDMVSTVQFRVRVPGWAIRPVLEPLAMKILQQDADILKLQSETIRNFGGEQFVSTEIDLLGPHIWRLLRQAERRNLDPDGEPYEKEVAMIV